MRCLVVRSEDEVLRFPMPAAEARLGSDPSNDLVVPFVGVSRFHARFVPDPIAPRLFDLGSKNGLVVKGKRHREVALLPGISVAAGAALIAIEEGATSDLELAVSFPAPQGRARQEPPRDSTVTGTLGEGASGREALALIRDLDRHRTQGASGSGPADLLERLRRLLGARTVALLRREGESLDTAFLAGSPPDLEDLDAVATREAASRTEFLTLGDRTAAWRGSATGSGLSALVVQPEGLGFVSWQRELLEFSLDQLDAPVPSPANPAPEAPRIKAGLVFPDGMVPGTSAAMRGLLGQIAKTVHSRLDVLLLGETGTGKELIARMIHASGPRASSPFVAINCSAIPSELLESELFGVRARVATGVDPQTGRIIEAHGGTLLLDEIGEMPPALQPKLLRFLQEREVHSIGASKPEKVDVRVISISNRDLLAEVKAGRFRADLYYRLRGLQFHVPPLRDRREDIADLVASIAARAAEEDGKQIRGISRKALDLLEAYDWPGNVRELQSEVRRAVLFCSTDTSLSAEHFRSVEWRVGHGSAEKPDAEATTGSVAAAAQVAQGTKGLRRLDLRARIEELERETISTAMRSTGGNRTQAAELLGLTRNGLALKLRRLFPKSGDTPGGTDG